MPRFSIIIPAFNAADTIADTLGAILAQTCHDWEAFIVDDGSTDATREIVAHWERNDSRFRLVGHPGNGPSDARNFIAFHKARGEIMAFCDADDLWTNTKLAEVDAAMDDINVAGTFARVAIFTHHPKDARSLSAVPSAALDVATLMGENPVCTMSNLCIRRDAFVASGGFDPAMVHNEDLEWLIRVVGAGACLRGLDRLQVWYRSAPTGLSSNLAAMRSSRAQALLTARRFGYTPSRATEAIYLRYLARRALRLDTGRTEALTLALRGLLLSPQAFCSPARRGVATAIAACLAPLMPRPLRRALFSH